MAITTTSVLPAPVQQSFSEKLLSVPTPHFVYGLGADRKTMPANSGNILRMQRYNALSTATVPLGNSGITPPAQQLTAVDIDAEIKFYGTYIYLNEQVVLQNQDKVLNSATKRLGVSLRQTEDELMRNMLISTASVINCVNGANGDNPTEINRTDIDEVIRTLANNDAYTVADNIEADDKFGTGPVRDSYLAFGSTQLISDLENVRGFMNKSQYPYQDTTLRSEWGNVSNLRFFLSSIGSQEGLSMNGNDVYNISICGTEAYAAIEQDAYSTQFIYRPPIYDGPLALNASVGYKMAAAQCITNDAWVFNLRTTLAA